MDVQLVFHMKHDGSQSRPKSRLWMEGGEREEGGRERRKAERGRKMKGRREERKGERESSQKTVA